MSWKLVERGGLLVATCTALDSVEGLAHAFSTRIADGASDFDAGGGGEVPEGVRERRARLAAAAGLSTEHAPFELSQVHGLEIVRVDRAEPGSRADGALWLRSPGGPPPAVRTADCVPILIADRSGRAAAAIHAGWRGTSGGIAIRAVEAFESAGFPAGSLVAALGPAILACCYEVDRSVARRVERASDGVGRVAEGSAGADRVRIDLHAANRKQLSRAGVAPERIHGAAWCTRCRGDLFFSYRGQGPAAGRQMAVIGPAAPRGHA